MKIVHQIFFDMVQKWIVVTPHSMSINVSVPLWTKIDKPSVLPDQIPASQDSFPENITISNG